MKNHEKPRGDREGSLALDLTPEDYALYDRILRGRGGLAVAGKVALALKEGVPLSAPSFNKLELALIDIAKQELSAKKERSHPPPKTPPR